MATLGFLRRDFQVFSIEGFDARIGKIDELIHRRLVRLGDELAPELSRTIGAKLFPHIARHPRRIASPPAETWLALGPSPKGYKRLGHLALCVSGLGIHVRAIVRPEAENRPAIAHALEANAAMLEKSLRGTRIQDYAGWDFRKLPPRVHADSAFFSKLARSLEGTSKVRSGSIDVGFGWPVDEALHLERAEVLDAMRELAPLYRVVGP